MICYRCDIDKPDSEFYPHLRFCKACKVKQALAYRAANRDRLTQKRREFAQRNKEKIRKSSRDQYHRLKALAFDAYGNACACCGETERMFLTIDDVRDDGAAERRADPRMSGSKLLQRLRREGYPATFQVLCMNCNHAKGRGGCPHGHPAGQPYRQLEETG